MTDTTEGRALLRASGQSPFGRLDHAAWLITNAPAMLDALDAVERVRAIHQEDEDGNCGHCAEGLEGTPYDLRYPCPTRRALDGDTND